MGSKYWGVVNWGWKKNTFAQALWVYTGSSPTATFDLKLNICKGVVTVQISKDIAGLECDEHWSIIKPFDLSLSQSPKGPLHWYTLEVSRIFHRRKSVTKYISKAQNNMAGGQKSSMRKREGVGGWESLKNFSNGRRKRGRLVAGEAMLGCASSSPATNPSTSASGRFYFHTFTISLSQSKFNIFTFTLSILHLQFHTFTCKAGLCQ